MTATGRAGPLAAAVLMLGALSLGACGTLPRDTAPIRLADTALSRGADPRLDLTDPATQAAMNSAITHAAASAGRPPIILALSGGGANGAYGAGVLSGWSERGDRPGFDLVTGVSTGALSAPFAFLGSDWDEALHDAYTSGQTEALVSWRSLAAFIAPSLLSPRVLSDLVEAEVTPELLRRVAEEHAKGRRLLVVTTNLDAERAVIWDMGLIATQGDANALALFRQVLLASASIPGVFPPVLIAGVRDDGTIVREMHVDGGVTVPFLASPAGPIVGTTGPRDPDGPPTGRIYIIINGQSAQTYSVTSGRIPSILGRTYTTSSKATTARELAAAMTFAHAEGMALEVTDIPADVRTSSLDFHRAAMISMFELGRSRAAAGEAWRRADASDRPDAAAEPAAPGEGSDAAPAQAGPPVP